MKRTFFSTMAAICFAAGAQAATVGSFDSSRTYLSYQLTGSNYDELEAAAITDGHTVKAATGAVTAAYLADVDVFFSGGVDTNSTAAEIAALTSWISAGGTLVFTGDNSFVFSAANSWLNAFGLNISGSNTSGGSFAAGPDPLLDNGVAGTNLEFAAGSSFDAGSYDTLATVSGKAAIVRKTLGSGRIIATADFNFWDDPASNQSEQFFQNILNSDTTAPVPLPASLPLLLAGLGGFAAIRRRKKA